MKQGILPWWLLLAGGLGCLPAGAQTSLPDLHGDIATAPVPPPCLRAYCGSNAALLEPAASGGVLTAPAQQNWHGAAASDWKEHIGKGKQGEDYNCLLSMGFGAQLGSQGYRGVRLFGRTHTVSRPAGKVAQ